MPQPNRAIYGWIMCHFMTGRIHLKGCLAPIRHNFLTKFRHRPLENEAKRCKGRRNLLDDNGARQISNTIFCNSYCTRCALYLSPLLLSDILYVLAMRLYLLKLMPNIIEIGETRDKRQETRDKRQEIRTHTYHLPRQI